MRRYAGSRGDDLRLVAFALHPLAQHLAIAPDGIRFLASAAFGRLLIIAPLLHLSEDAFALHLLFENPQRLVDIVVANENLHRAFLCRNLRRLWKDPALAAMVHITLFARLDRIVVEGIPGIGELAMEVPRSLPQFEALMDRLAFEEVSRMPERFGVVAAMELGHVLNGVRRRQKIAAVELHQPGFPGKRDPRRLLSRDNSAPMGPQLAHTKYHNFKERAKAERHRLDLTPGELVEQAAQQGRDAFEFALMRGGEPRE